MITSPLTIAAIAAILSCLSSINYCLSDPVTITTETSQTHSDKNSAVHVLTDDNFEHDTQASSGMTTGTWLVEFYAPWCGRQLNIPLQEYAIHFRAHRCS